MATEAENQLTDAMRRAVEDTQFNPAAIAVARSTVRRRRQLLTGIGAAVVLAGVGIGVANLGDGSTRNNDVVATTGSEVQLMTQPEAGDTYPAALVTGALIVTDNQCLAVQIPTEPEPLTYNVYWPAGYTAERDPAGAAVLNDDTGQRVAAEGDTVSITGGLLPENHTFPQPDHPCATGQVWGAAPGIVTDPAAPE